MLNAAAARIVGLLGLVPLPDEGGYFRETYRSGEKIPSGALPGRYQSPDCGRHHSTQIYFLLAPGVASLMHLVQSDEVFHHYAGDAVEQLHIFPDGSTNVVTIGSDLERGERPQMVVPRGVWQGCRIQCRSGSPDTSGIIGGSAGYALLGCTVSPGFEWADFRLGTREEMLALCPNADAKVAGLIDALTPSQGEPRP
ncbi:MAG: cupin domain-containing protein [Phycisphaerales bacterium]|nr:cupin domain-containing protein [Phycisphaerales bacterium]